MMMIDDDDDDDEMMIMCFILFDALSYEACRQVGGASRHGHPLAGEQVRSRGLGLGVAQFHAMNCDPSSDPQRCCSQGSDAHSFFLQCLDPGHGPD